MSIWIQLSCVVMKPFYFIFFFLVKIPEKLTHFILTLVTFYICIQRKALHIHPIPSSIAVDLVMARMARDSFLVLVSCVNFKRHISTHIITSELSKVLHAHTLIYHAYPTGKLSIVICGIFVSMMFSCIPFSVGLNINFTVIFCNFAWINIFIIGNRGFTKNVTEKKTILQTSAV